MVANEQECRTPLPAVDERLVMPETRYEIIDGEDKSRPYSDDELVGKLAAHGLKVARRTVTKYRKAMSIPSSSQRREF